MKIARPGAGLDFVMRKQEGQITIAFCWQRRNFLRNSGHCRSLADLIIDAGKFHVVLKDAPEFGSGGSNVKAVLRPLFAAGRVMM